MAKEIAKRLNVRVFVFEEGYIRPNFITLEEDGVNGHYGMMSNPPKHYPLPGVLPAELQQPGSIFLITAIYSMMYYMASASQRKKFPNYHHHRPFGCLAEGAHWIRSGLRNLKYAKREKPILKDILSQYDGNYFLCPLQVHCDMQVIVHSSFSSIEHFIGEVLASFRENADSNKAIVFKHHPMDRGYTDYTVLFDNLIAELGLQGRVFYVEYKKFKPRITTKPPHKKDLQPGYFTSDTATNYLPVRHESRFNELFLNSRNHLYHRMNLRA